MARLDSRWNRKFWQCDHHEWTATQVDRPEKLDLETNYESSTTEAKKLLRNFALSREYMAKLLLVNLTSASSAVCSSPIFDRSQTWSRRSVPLEAKMVSLWGDHWTWKISSLCDSNECSFSFKFLKNKLARKKVVSAPQIPQRNGLISWAGSQNVLRVWVEWKAVHLRNVSVNNIRRLK